MTCLVDLLGERQRLGDTRKFPIATVGLDSVLVVTLQLFLVELQSLLFGSLGGVGHIAFMRLFDSENSSYGSTSDEDFAEETSTLLVLKSVDGEDLLTVNIGQAKDCLDLVKTLSELALTC